MDSGDILGLISCLAGTALFFIPMPSIILPFVMIIGGAAVLVMGIIAVVKDSKIGIGGIILGAVLAFFGVVDIMLGGILNILGGLI